MKQNWLDLAAQKLCLLPMLALLVSGCASHQPSATAGTETRTEINSNNEYLLYVLAAKSTYLETWKAGANTFDSATAISVETKVVIAKDGKVESANIVKPSGNRPLDESVQRTLDQVKLVQPFGAGAKDERRAFTINFELKPRPQ